MSPLWKNALGTPFGRLCTPGIAGAITILQAMPKPVSSWDPWRLQGPAQEAVLAGCDWLTAPCRRATSASRSATWGRFGSSSRDR
jgi:hypothetical protein